MILRQIPNVLTIFRLILIVPFMVYLFQKEYTIAFYTFIIAGFTDGLDGWLARHFSWQSFFGSFADPFADKLLVTSSFISLAIIGSLPWWLVILVFLRDLTITMGVLTWIWLIRTQLNFEPTLLSKFNTTCQIILVILCLFELAYFHFPQYLIKSLIFLCALTTTTSYINYIWTWGKKAWSKTHPA